MFLHPFVEKVCLNMLYNWPWTLSVTLMLPWTPYSYLMCRKKGGSTGWTSENVSVKPSNASMNPQLSTFGTTALQAFRIE
ncbi:hypothetical protein T12_11938 [Trichinella patagoniensis]|uniref:Uncharacterized protein n=1 Tax=Trichinella patagoniensis TaxID=990121 RepID=A0A0V0ZUL0_9BILA|nr:hypothetical protein T12_11938 [Trichinella patagoniensis]